MNTTHYCLECNRPIASGVFEFSQDVYGHPLCIGHQTFITESGASQQAVDLYFALKQRGIPVALEYFDGHKHIDIALPGKLYIEVSGFYQHDSMQAMTDLTRSIYSLEKNISTITIPTYLLDDAQSFWLTVDELTRACRSLLKRSSFWELAHSLTPVQMQ